MEDKYSIFIMISVVLFTGEPANKLSEYLNCVSASDSSKISTNAMSNILEQLKVKCRRNSTKANYYSIWKLFNKFIMKLHIIPNKWENRAFLFLASLVQDGKKSATIQSYFSAIKSVLTYENYKLSYDVIQLKAVTRACRLMNDKLCPKLPIRIKFLEMILFKVDRKFNSQFYLKTLYQTILLVAYYGLFRIGEVTKGDHVIKARNVYLGQNKNKVLFMLYSSKTHDVSKPPQKVKISEVSTGNTNKSYHFYHFKHLFCYSKLRQECKQSEEQLFIFRDGTPVEPNDIRVVLKEAIVSIGLDPRLYSFHGIRAGRTTDLFHWGYTIEEIKIIGRWRSNAIYRYLKW